MTVEGAKSGVRLEVRKTGPAPPSPQEQRHHRLARHGSVGVEAGQGETVHRTGGIARHAFKSGRMFESRVEKKNAPPERVRRRSQDGYGKEVTPSTRSFSRVLNHGRDIGALLGVGLIAARVLSAITERCSCWNGNSRSISCCIVQILSQQKHFVLQRERTSSGG